MCVCWGGVREREMHGEMHGEMHTSMRDSEPSPFLSIAAKAARTAARVGPAAAAPLRDACRGADDRSPTDSASSAVGDSTEGLGECVPTSGDIAAPGDRFGESAAPEEAEPGEAMSIS